MKAFIFAVGVAMTLASSIDYAAAAGRHHQTKSERIVVRQPTRTNDAYAAWPAQRPLPHDYGTGYYSGGYSAPAGR